MTTPPNPAPVEQADREAAALYWERQGPAIAFAAGVKEVRAGYEDSDSLVQAFARHRIEATRIASLDGWRPIEEAPKDGSVFIARNSEHPSFGSWAMLRSVRYALRDREFVCIDLGAWLHVGDIEPDYENGRATPAPITVPFSIAADDLNTGVRYEWRPLPPPPETGEEA